MITDKGNINREIRKHNSLVREIKEKIASLTSWISEFKNKLFSKYEEYKQEKKEEYENKIELFNLREYISIYHDMQVEKRQDLNAYASQKKGVYDLKKFASAISYLSTNQLTTIADLQRKIESLQSQYRKINKAIKTNTIKIENLNKCLVYANIIRDNKSVYDEWESKKIFKDSFYQSHKNEIEKYQRARAMIQKATGSSTIKVKDWQREIKGCEDEITKLNKQSELIKNEYQNINHIKYAVKVVNDDYGIDLTVEIDKAIKRGEKESIIKKLKEYKQQSDKYDRRKAYKKEQHKYNER